jgi:hypothetical protein
MNPIQTLKTAYTELTEQCLNTIPIRSEADFSKVTNILNKFLSEMDEFSCDDSNLKLRMTLLKGMLVDPERFGGIKSFEFREAVLTTVAKKIITLNSLRPEERKEEIARQERSLQNPTITILDMFEMQELMKDLKG